MQINSNIEQNLAKAMNKVTLPKKSRSYELCIKADALRFAKSYRESVKYYLDSIMMDRDHQEAYWGLATSYKYLTEYKKAIKTLEKLVAIDDKNETTNVYTIKVSNNTCGTNANEDCRNYTVAFTDRAPSPIEETDEGVTTVTGYKTDMTTSAVVYKPDGKNDCTDANSYSAACEEANKTKITFEIFSK